MDFIILYFDFYTKTCIKTLSAKFVFSILMFGQRNKSPVIQSIKKMEKIFKVRLYFKLRYKENVSQFDKGLIIKLTKKLPYFLIPAKRTVFIFTIF